jgi:glutamate/tyrosine decarboxylase-like PLP-dependent enzyme
MVDEGKIFTHAAELAAAFRASLPDRPVGLPADLDGLRRVLGGPLPENGADAQKVVDRLAASVDPGLVATAGPRYFGFVTGGSLPAAAAADVLTTAWDQNGFNVVYSPAAAVTEQVVGGWLKDLLGLPASTSVGFVTGSQEANTVGLAAARHHVLARAGWDVERSGLSGAPRVRLVASEERHATVGRALRFLGFGDAALETVRADANGAMDMGDLERALRPVTGEPLIVVVQAGNVNTGACDSLRAAAELTHERGGWLHVDGAFGLWAAASPRLRHLVDGIELADSWGCDGHKWLNLPYDSAFVFCAHPESHAAAMTMSAAYLVDAAGAVPVPSDYVLSASRRARGFTAWAAIHELGRQGVADLVDRCSRLAVRFADQLAAGGLEIANEVMLNQVLVGLRGDAARVDAVIEGIQRDGTCWMGGTTWRGRRMMRIAVSNWSTTEADVDRSVEAILRVDAATP